MKTQMMQFRVNDEEKALIEKCAKKAGMTVSEYISEASTRKRNGRGDGSAALCLSPVWQSVVASAASTTPALCEVQKPVLESCPERKEKVGDTPLCLQAAPG